MARSLWSGTISFGLVNVPVRLYSAIRDRNLHFRQLHAADGAPIETRRVSSKTGREVPYEEIARERDGTIVTDEELATVAPRRTKTIDVEAFVELADVDPIHFDHPYVLVPAGEGARRAYRLLADVLAATDRAALGRIVLRTKEHLVALRVRDGLLSLTTMRFHDEIRPASEVDTGDARKPAKAQLDEAIKLVERLSVDWDPDRYEDEYRKRLQAVVRRKRKGKTITPPEPAADEQPEPATDLMEALQRSLAEVRG